MKGKQTAKKILGATLILVLVLNLLGFAAGYINVWVFWAVIVAIFLGVKVIFPKNKRK